jgi:hypothetical protein
MIIWEEQLQRELQDTYHHVRQNVQAKYTCDNPTIGLHHYEDWLGSRVCWDGNLSLKIQNYPISTPGILLPTVWILNTPQSFASK